MAKRRKKSGGGGRPRRRISGTSSGGWSNLLMIAAGVVIGGPATVAATKALVPANVNPTLTAVGQIGVGGYVAKSFKHPFVKGMGLGAMAVGGARLMAPITAKISGPDGYYDDYMSGDDDGLGGDEQFLDDDYMSGPGDEMLEDNGVMSGSDEFNM